MFTEACTGVKRDVSVRGSVAVVTSPIRWQLRGQCSWVRVFMSCYQQQQQQQQHGSTFTAVMSSWRVTGGPRRYVAQAAKGVPCLHRCLGLYRICHVTKTNGLSPFPVRNIHFEIRAKVAP
jgi:hypothetical protein